MTDRSNGARRTRRLSRRNTVFLAAFLLGVLSLLFLLTRDEEHQRTASRDPVPEFPTPDPDAGPPPVPNTETPHNEQARAADVPSDFVGSVRVFGVVLRQDGEPVQGASVLCVPAHFSIPDAATRAFLTDSTDDDGRFEFSGLAASTGYTLMSGSPELGVSSPQLVLDPRIECPLEVRLAPAHYYRVAFHDFAGEPISVRGHPIRASFDAKALLYASWMTPRFHETIPRLEMLGLSTTLPSNEVFVVLTGSRTPPVTVEWEMALPGYRTTQVKLNARKPSQWPAGQTWVLSTDPSDVRVVYRLKLADVQIPDEWSGSEDMQYQPTLIVKVEGDRRAFRVSRGKNVIVLDRERKLQIYHEFVYELEYVERRVGREIWVEPKYPEWAFVEIVREPPPVLPPPGLRPAFYLLREGPTAMSRAFVGFAVSPRRVRFGPVPPRRYTAACHRSSVPGSGTQPQGGHHRVVCG